MHGLKCFSFYYAIIRIFCSKDFDFLHLYDVEILIIRNIFSVPFPIHAILFWTFLQYYICCRLGGTVWWWSIAVI